MLRKYVTDCIVSQEKKRNVMIDLLIRGTYMLIDNTINSCNDGFKRMKENNFNQDIFRMEGLRKKCNDNT